MDSQILLRSIITSDGKLRDDWVSRDCYLLLKLIQEKGETLQIFFYKAREKCPKEQISRLLALEDYLRDWERYELAARPPVEL